MLRLTGLQGVSSRRILPLLTLIMFGAWVPVSSAQQTGAGNRSARLQQIPADLTYSTAEERRSLKMATKFVFRSARDKSKVLSSESFDAEILETQEKKRDNYRLFGAAGNIKFVAEKAGAPVVRWHSAYEIIRNSIFEFRCDASGKLVTCSIVKYGARYDEFSRREAQKMRLDVFMSYQCLALPLPNREVKPGETWTEKVSVKGGEEYAAVYLVLKYTYVGSVTSGRQTEAVIGLEGEVKLREDTRKPLFHRPKDAVKGLAHFDVKHGFMSRVELTLTDDFQVDDVALSRTIEMSLLRSPGNIYGIHPLDEE